VRGRGTIQFAQRLMRADDRRDAVPYLDYSRLRFHGGIGIVGYAIGEAKLGRI
jgi:hypothetical protein